MDLKVSVIIPTYNRMATLPRAVRSVLDQTMPDWELIVVDDGSTDESLAWLSQLAQSERRVRILSQPQSGVSRARNRGAQQALAPWLAFLDSDDEWLPHKLEKQLELAEARPNLPLIHSEEIWIRNGVRVNAMKKHQKAGGDIYAQSLKLCCISPSAALLKRDLFLELGGFREDFVVCEDYDLWLKITSRHPVGFIETPLIKKYGGHEDQLSQRYRAMDYWRILAIHDRLQSQQLCEEQMKLSQQELLAKASILLKGYRKHHNLENYQNIFDCYIRTLNC